MYKMKHCFWFFRDTNLGGKLNAIFKCHFSHVMRCKDAFASSVFEIILLFLTVMVCCEDYNDFLMYSNQTNT